MSSEQQALTDQQIDELIADELRPHLVAASVHLKQAQQALYAAYEVTCTRELSGAEWEADRLHELVKSLIPN